MGEQSGKDFKTGTVFLRLGMHKYARKIVIFVFQLKPSISTTDSSKKPTTGGGTTINAFEKCTAEGLCCGLCCLLHLFVEII